MDNLEITQKMRAIINYGRCHRSIQLFRIFVLEKERNKTSNAYSLYQFIPKKWQFTPNDRCFSLSSKCLILLLNSEFFR